jgi:CBS domain containing-hemolysin-like protein
MGEVWIDIGIVLVLLVIGGLFTATELALVTSRSGQLEAIAQRGSRGARVARLAHGPTRYLAAVQIGSIVAGFFAAAFGADAASRACSLVPVIDGSTENIIGFVHVRDLLDPAHRGRPVTLGEIVRGMKVFPAMKHLLPTLSEMQAAGAHIAMVVDEYGAIVRVVTVENLVESWSATSTTNTTPSPAHRTRSNRDWAKWTVSSAWVSSGNAPGSDCRWARMAPSGAWLSRSSAAYQRSATRSRSPATDWR